MEQSESASFKKMQEQMRKSQSIFSLKGNQKFLSQELSFFIENLQKKAVESGLEEDILIPKKDQKDKQIYEYIKQNVISGRPQSAVTGHSSTVTKTSNTFKAEGSRNDPSGLDQTMRSSFYSIKDNGFAEQRGDIIQSIKTTSVLDLSKEDMEKIKLIRGFMNEQAEGLQNEIEDIKTKLMNSTNEQQESENRLNSVPSEKELKDYSSKLEAQLLNSEKTIKIHKTMNIPKDHIRFQKINEDPTIKLTTPGASIKAKVAGLGDVSKPPLKLSTKGPIKMIPRSQIDTSLSN